MNVIPPHSARQAAPDAPARQGTGTLVGAAILAGALATGALLFVLLPLLFFVPSFWGSAAIALGVVSAVAAFMAKQLGVRWVLILAPAIFLLPLTVIALVPLGGEPVRSKPAPWDGAAWEGTKVRHWDLPTGSRIGYVHFASETPNGLAPIVFLHGGPGGGIVPRDGDFARQLNAEGFDVYLFDQAGVGWSDLLEVDEYTIDRMVDDLEAIRIAIGGGKINIVGHSWGGSLAAHYLVEHDENVARVWLSNPGEYGGVIPTRGADEEPALHAGEEGGGIPFNGIPPIRLFLASGLTMVGAHTGAVEDLVSQQQMVRYIPDHIDTVSALDSSRCADDPYEPEEVAYAPKTNFNFYVLMALNRAVSSHDETEGLDSIETPMVVARGICDYIPWDAQRRYRDHVQSAQLVLLPDVGHDMRPATPIAAFFTTGDPQLDPYLSDEVPSPGS